MNDASFSPNLPQATEAERMILGCIILNNEVLTQAEERLRPDDFFNPSHRKVYRAMVALREQGLAINPVSLVEELKSSGEIEQVGGMAFVATLFDGAPRFSQIESYVAIVKDKSVCRRLIQVGSAIVNKALDDEADATDQLASARKLIEQIDDPADNSRWITTRQAAEDWRTHYIERLRSGRRFDGIATGFHDLDAHLSGISKGDVNLIAARPGIGKTALLTGIAEKAPQSIHNRDLIVGFFETELTKDQLVMRWASSISKVKLKAIREGTMTKEDKNNLAEAFREISKLPVYIDDQTALSPNSFRAAVQRLQKQHPGCEVLAIVDYIQMMRADGTFKDKRTEITEISHRLKEMVKDYLGCYLIAAASLNRMAEGRRDNEPELSDLRESGDLESDAATVIMLHRPAMAKSDYEPSTNEKVIAKIVKGRFCGPGRVELGYDATCVRFGDYYREPTYQSRYTGSSYSSNYNEE